MLQTLNPKPQTRYKARLLDGLAAAVSSSVSGADWEVTYYQMIAAEKLAKAVPAICTGGDAKPLGMLVKPNVLQHRHSWVKLCAGRLLGTLQAGGRTRLGQLLDAAGGAFGVLKALCSQLAGDTVDERLGEQIVKNLVFLCGEVLADPGLSPDEALEGEPSALPSDDESGDDGGVEDEDDKEEEGEGTIGPKKRGASPSSAAGGSKRKKGGAGEAEKASASVPRAVRWVFVRLSFVARKHGGDRRSFVFRFLAAMAVKMGGVGFLPLLKCAVNPIFRAIETDQSGPAESCKELAQELVEMLQGLVGMKPFFDAYNGIREVRKRRTDQRKGERALAKLLDPKMESQRRINKNLKKREVHKRKIEGFKEQRGAFEMKKSRRDADNA